jgi:predicted RNase H-like HicB family nuclease
MMGNYYQVPIQITKQEDDLWRVEVPVLQGCWVDAETVEQGIHDIQEVIDMTLDFYLKEGWPLPSGIAPVAKEPFFGALPIAMDEYVFKRPPARPRAIQKAKRA